MDFASVYAEQERKLLGHSRAQRVPGMNTDEVHSEMLECLWRAMQTFDSGVGTSIEQWWWVLWVRRKGDLIDAFYAKKRRMEVMMTDDEMDSLCETLHLAAVGAEEPPTCPVNWPIAADLWDLIAQGYTGVEARAEMGITIKKFYSVLTALNTQFVRDALMA